MLCLGGLTGEMNGHPSQKDAVFREGGDAVCVFSPPVLGLSDATSISNAVSQTGEEKAGEAMFRPEAEDTCSISQM